MASSMVQVVRLHKSSSGGLQVFFRKLDSETKRPVGAASLSSRLIAIEPVTDAYGVLHAGNDAMVTLRTETGSVYLAQLDKRVANRIAREVGKVTA